MIAICAVISGANDWEAVAEYGRSKEEWFKTFLALPNGIPSHDTFWRVFRALDPEQFERCFMNWIQAVSETLAQRAAAQRRGGAAGGGKGGGSKAGGDATGGGD